MTLGHYKQRAETIGLDAALEGGYEVLGVETTHIPEDRRVESVVSVEVFDYFEDDYDDFLE